MLFLIDPLYKDKIKHAEFRWLCNPYRHRLQSACICHSMFIEDPKPAAFTNESGVFFLIYSLNDYLWYLKQHVPPSINRSPFEGNSIWNANFLTGLISKGKEKKKIGYLYGSHKFNHIDDYQQIKCYHMFAKNDYHTNICLWLWVALVYLQLVLCIHHLKSWTPPS